MDIKKFWNNIINKINLIYLELWLWWNNTKIHNFIYYCKCKLWHKHNVLKIKTLSPTWHDRDEILTHAMFQVLSDFVEKEMTLPYNQLDKSDDPKYRAIGIKMKELYNWWHNKYLRFDPYKDANTHDKIAIAYQREKEMGKTLNEKLIKLLALREHMWT